MRSLYLKILALLLISSVLGVLTNTFRADGLSWILDTEKSLNPGLNPQLAARVEISLDELREHLFAGTASFVDARRVESFEKGHLATAINIPAHDRTLYLDRVYQMLPPEGLIIIYCDGENCEESNDVFEFLVESGYQIENMRIFSPGWIVLEEQSDLPISDGLEG